MPKLMPNRSALAVPRHKMLRPAMNPGGVRPSSDHRLNMHFLERARQCLNSDTTFHTEMEGWRVDT